MNCSDAIDLALSTIPKDSHLWELSREELVGAIQLMGALFLGEMIDEIGEDER
jgi:hypothetical protein